MNNQQNQYTDEKLLAIVRDLRPYEEVRIKKDDLGKPLIIIITQSTVIFRFEDPNQTKLI